MQQKASRHPPVHDQIDTPIDLSVAVRGGRREQRERDGSRSQREAEQRWTRGNDGKTTTTSMKFKWKTS